jgi:hypothetical protein
MLREQCMNQPLVLHFDNGTANEVADNEGQDGGIRRTAIVQPP